MKKKQMANIAMVALILVIVAAGLLAVGSVRGWFDRNDGNTAVLTDIRGMVNLRRDGVVCLAEGDTVLRAGDEITCVSGATAKIAGVDSSLTLGGGAVVKVVDPASQGFSAEVTAGEVFVDTVSPLHLSFDGKDIAFADTVASLSVRTGEQSISVFLGTVDRANAGQMLCWDGNTQSVTELSIQTLNDFNMEQMRTVNGRRALCFSNDQLDQLKADRLAQMQAPIPEATTAPSQETTPNVTETVATEPPEATLGTTEPTTAESTATEPTVTESPVTEPTAAETTATEPPATETVATEPEPSETEAALSCTLAIRCDTILDNWDSLDPAKAEYVPSDGWILYTTMTFSQGETVFDVLNRACSDYGIQLEYSWTPMYDSYYVEGIHHLYEFDCGFESGWMFQVNGSFPNYGCSSYTLSDGDQIVWCYTCSGLGADVGA